LKNLLVVLVLIAVAILIEILIEGTGRKQDMVSIVGVEPDSIGGSYIYFDNGEIYHRTKRNSDASSVQDLETPRGMRMNEFGEGVGTDGYRSAPAEERSGSF
jgi:Mor family transcriptional regulator